MDTDDTNSQPIQQTSLSPSSSSSSASSFYSSTPVLASSHDSAISSSSFCSNSSLLQSDYKRTIGFSFGNCKICSDQASGVHYGVATCEGCKGFFKRSLTKFIGYVCMAENKCLVNKITRNRCKSCRYRKCIRKGMSIDEIRMGRMSKDAKQKVLVSHDIESDGEYDDDVYTFTNPMASANNEIISLDRMNKHGLEVSSICLKKVDENWKHFEEWLKLQLIAIRNNASNQNNLNINAIFLSLSLPDQNRRDTRDITEMFNFLSKDSFLDPMCIMPNTIFYNDTDLPKIILVKNRICQIYKDHIKKSNIINNTYERLQTRDFISSTVKDVTREQMIDALLDTLLDFAKWIFDFVNDLNSISSHTLCKLDLSTLITQTIYYLCIINTVRFYKDKESYTILKNGLQMSSKRFIMVFGYELTGIVSKVYTKFKALDLSENELALFHAFVLTSCNPDRMIDRENYIQIQTIFKKALIYEFELNGKDKKFFNQLKEVFDLCNICDSYKENYLEMIKEQAQAKMFEIS